MCVQGAARAQTGWTSFIDAVEEELVDTFLIAPDAAGPFRGRSQGQKWVWQACKTLWCDKVPRNVHEMQSWRRKVEHLQTHSHCPTATDELLLGEEHIDRTSTLVLVRELLVLARQAHKLTAVLVSLVQCARRQTFWKLWLRTISLQPVWMMQLMEAEAIGLADQALRVQQQTSRKPWRAWLEKHDGRCSEGAPDEQLKLRETWAAICRANTPGPPVLDEPLFHWPSTGAMRRGAGVRRGGGAE